MTGESSETQQENQQRQLGSDLKVLVNNSARSDVTFIVESKPVYAHRCILMARCEVLDRMVNSPMREGHENTIQIPNYPYGVFVAFMEYLYTNDIMVTLQESSPETLLHLYRIADQYLVDSLKR